MIRPPESAGELALLRWQRAELEHALRFGEWSGEYTIMFSDAELAERGFGRWCACDRPECAKERRVGEASTRAEDTAASANFCRACWGGGSVTFNRHGTVESCRLCRGSGREPAPCACCGATACGGCAARCVMDCKCTEEDAP